MQNNFIQQISPLTRILLLIILTLIIFLASSLYLILFLTTLTLILFLITEKKVKSYVNIVKKILLLLLFFVFVYIIFLGEYKFLYIMFVLYKALIISVILAIFILNSNFKSVHEGIYGILIPFRYFNIDIEKLSFYATLTFSFIRYMLDSSKELYKKIDFYGSNKLNIKKYFLSKVIYSINKITEYQDEFFYSFYSLSYKKNNLKSNIILIIFIILLISCIFKEVIM